MAEPRTRLKPAPCVVQDAHRRGTGSRDR